MARRDFALEVYFSQWEFVARHNLAASDLESMPVQKLMELADDEGRELWQSLDLGYSPTYGLPALREAIASTYDHVAAEDVLCFAGAQEGLAVAFEVLLGPGDHAVVLTPGYQSSETIPLALCDVTGVPLRPEDSWLPDVDAIEQALRPNTRVVAVNFPHNPSGAVPDHHTWRRLVQLCEERGVWLLSDEVYRGVELDPRTTLPQAADMSGTALSLNVMSKAYGMGGLRVGWIACRDRAVLDRMERAKHFASICNSAPSEVLAVVALRAKEHVLARNRSIIADNVPLFEEFFGRHRDLFEWVPPQGGCVCFPRYLGPDGVEAMCADLVEQEGVLLLPASVYESELGPVPRDRFRVGLGRSGAAEALERWEDWLLRQSF
ncbi:aminotransferase class I/II-fold pyridoxal phosphate-dependent enzyme [Aeromicrobium sp. CF3.5]|uniref:aminotransferase class I/II-fold pyridoxal phosphate-dependent enzyme n=1 Tax=Aeromicrobium sp. CF3.5 TaxID=3373078 RepID=UPI003EE74E56